MGSSDTKSDDVIINFVEKFQCDFLVWFNAIAPLQELKDIKISPKNYYLINSNHCLLSKVIIFKPYMKKNHLILVLMENSKGLKI